jgi:hypothetical protein
MREANKRFIRLLGYVVIVITSMQFHDLLQTPSMLFFGFLWFAKLQISNLAFE